MFPILLNRRIKIRRIFLWKRGLFFVFGMSLALCSPPAGHAGESKADRDKLAIIELIEDRLAAAFTIRSEKEAPDFGTLDRIYPNWHKGAPAKARRQWTFHGFQTYHVSYAVQTVFMDRPETAKVEGKKRVTSSRKRHLRQVETDVTGSRFTITCRRNLSGAWEIMTATDYE